MYLSHKSDISYGATNFLPDWGFISLVRALLVGSFAELRLMTVIYLE
jgi:hypothetical protein